MKFIKKFFVAILIGLVGVVLLITSFSCGVERVDVRAEVRSLGEGRYTVKVFGEVKTTGNFSIKNAELKIIIKDKNGRVLEEIEKEIHDTAQYSYGNTDIYSSQPDSREFEVEVSKISFNNGTCVFAAVALLVGAGGIALVQGIKDKKKQDL